MDKEDMLSGSPVSGYESDLESADSLPHRSLRVPRARRRRERTQFSLADLDQLEAAFRVDRYPDINDRDSLAAQLGVTEDRIQVWFQNRRSKLRRRLMEHRTSIPRSAPYLTPAQLAMYRHRTVPSLSKQCYQQSQPQDLPPSYHISYISNLPNSRLQVPNSSASSDKIQVVKEEKEQEPPVEKCVTTFTPMRPWETSSPTEKTTPQNIWNTSLNQCTGTPDRPKYGSSPNNTVPVLTTPIFTTMLTPDSFAEPLMFAPWMLAGHAGIHCMNPGYATMPPLPLSHSILPWMAH